MEDSGRVKAEESLGKSIGAQAARHNTTQVPMTSACRRTQKNSLYGAYSKNTDTQTHTSTCISMKATESQMQKHAKIFYLQEQTV